MQPTGRCEPVLVREARPENFFRAFAAAVAGDGEVFLGNPLWSDGELARALEQIPTARPLEPVRDRGWVMIPTGGTSGGIRFARHDGFTLAAAVKGFLRHFALPQVNAVGVLPLFHVSGFMAWMRCVATGGEHRAWDWKRLEDGDWPELATDRPWVISLVPTQLDRLLRQPSAVARLRSFRVIFLGGAPAWPDLLDRAAAARLRLSLSYGMTETAAMVTALRPEEFLAGERNAGSALPHVRIELSEEGVVRLGGSSLFRGYYPDWRHERKFFETADLGEFDLRRRLHIVGRRDAAIITGGEKVHPAEVEAVVRDATGVVDFAVIGLPDAEWGERVVGVYPRGSDFDAVRAEAALRALAAPRRPKQFIALPVWPRNEAGKLNRVRLVELAQAELRTGAAQGGA
ncbi:MAG: 2-succinylbenzoate-CoA ligase [Opitutus sp.]|nr:2-succinylbenzoate-CoA ligase [Opitutus sp.]